MLIFNSISQAEQHILEYDRNTPIYIDSSLEDNQNGEEYAKKLYGLGFHTIYLATGYNPNNFKPMYWIKDIVGKEPPF